MARGSFFSGCKWHGSQVAQYSFPVDAWAAGYLMYVMELGQNVFGLKPVASDLVCLHRILSFVGFPSEQSRLKLQWIRVVSSEPQRLLPCNTAVQKVAAGLLVLDPFARLTAAAAFKKLSDCCADADIDIELKKKQ